MSGAADRVAVIRLVFLGLAQSRGLAIAPGFEEVAASRRPLRLLDEVFSTATSGAPCARRLAWSAAVRLAAGELDAWAAEGGGGLPAADRLAGCHERLVRNAGRHTGAHYTPRFLADHVLSRSLDLWYAGDVGPPPTVFDPACGGGAFLLAALRQFVAREPGADPFEIVATRLFGMDLDPGAVETAKLALLLESLAGTVRSAAAADVAGASTGDAAGISPVGRSPVEWTAGWRNLAVGDALDPRSGGAGGFDIVAVNPPFASFSGRQTMRPVALRYRAATNGTGAGGWPGLHGLFVRRAVCVWSRRITAFVLPGQVGHLAGYAPLRELVGRRTGLVEVRYWGERVFPGAVTPVLSFVADARHAGGTEVVDPDGRARRAAIRPGQPWQPTAPAVPSRRVEARCGSLGRLVGDVGVHTGNCAGKLLVPLGASGGEAPVDPRADATGSAVAPAAPGGVAPVLEGRLIDRYRCAPPLRGIRTDLAPGPGEYFSLRRAGGRGDVAFLIRQTAAHPIVGPRRFTTLFRNSLLALFDPGPDQDVHYLVGLLNSGLLRYIYRIRVPEARQRAFPQVKVRSLRALPILRVDRADPGERRRHDGIVDRVRRILACGRLLDEAGAAEAGPHARTARAEMRALDAEIDTLVLELYAVSDATAARVREDPELERA